MIYGTDVAIYKTTNLISKNSKKAIDAVLKHALNIETIENEDVHNFKLDNNDYSVVISKADLFDTDQSPFNYLVVLEGAFKDYNEVKNNISSTILSFPLWLITEEQLNGEEGEALKAVKSLYVDQNQYSPRNFDYNPKVISANEALVVPVLELLNKEFEEDLVKFYLEEKSTAFNNFIFTLEHLKQATIEKKGSRTFSKYKNAGYPALYFESSGYDCWIRSGDSYGFYVTHKEGVYSIWTIDIDNFYEYGEDGEHINPVSLYWKDIQENKDHFVKWLTEEHIAPEMIFTKDKSIKETVLSQVIEDTYIQLSLELTAVMQFCKYEIKELFIPTAEEMISFDLGFSSHKSLIGWLFLGSTSFSWKDGGLINKDKTTPYQKLKNSLPYNEKDSDIEAASELPYSDALIKSLPNNLDESFKPYIKEAYELLISGQYPHVKTEGEDMNKIEKRLKRLSII